jgi:magnesium-transporting ATPase (P-type)
VVVQSIGFGYFLSLCFGYQYSFGLFWWNWCSFKNGILFKGSNFLDAIANIQNVVMDKTGTMTEGVLKYRK